MLKVKIVVANPTEGSTENVKGQKYGVSAGTSETTTDISDFYNRAFLEEPRYDIYGFITGNDRFTTEDSLQTIVSEFEKNLEMIGIVYGDKLLHKNGKIIQQIYPPYSLSTKSIFNPSIFVNGHIDVPIFDIKLNYLASYDAIMKIGMACHVIHIPKFLITSSFVNHNITEELEYYVRKSS